METEHHQCDECESPGIFHSGLPGVVARVEGGRILGNIERCDYCERFETDADAEAALREAIGGCIGAVEDEESCPDCGETLTDCRCGGGG